jgi:hypothetical protein
VPWVVIRCQLPCFPVVVTCLCLCNLNAELLSLNQGTRRVLISYILLMCTTAR